MAADRFPLVQGGVPKTWDGNGLGLVGFPDKERRVMADTPPSLQELQASQMSPRKTMASSGIGKPPKPK